MDETLLEYADCRGMSLAVDREAGVIRGVKILGLQSRNGRTYLPETLAQARGLYEGAKVNVNHPRGNPAGPRDYQDRIGVIRNVALVPDSGLFGDLHFNPRHALAGQLEWDAAHAPENVGLSHNVLARTVRRNEHVVVEAITKVVSVDLVADPATTDGLYEETDHTAEAERVQNWERQRPARRGSADYAPPLPDGRGSESGARRDVGPDWSRATVADLRRLRPDLVEALVTEAQAAKPRSRDQQSIEPRPTVDDAASFVRAIRG